MQFAGRYVDQLDTLFSDGSAVAVVLVRDGDGRKNGPLVADVRCAVRSTPMSSFKYWLPIDVMGMGSAIAHIAVVTLEAGHLTSEMKLQRAFCSTSMI